MVDNVEQGHVEIVQQEIRCELGGILEEGSNSRQENQE